MLNFEYPPIGGGAGNANYFLLREIRKYPEIRVDLVTSSAGNRFEICSPYENVRIFKLNVGKRGLGYWRGHEILSWTVKAYWLCKKLLKEEQYHLTHCWFGWPSGIIGYLFRKKMPYIVGLRGSDVPGYNERLQTADKYFFRWVSRGVWKNARVVTSVSFDLARLAQKTYKRSQIKIIPNGVDIARFKPNGRKRIRDQDLHVLFVGRLIKRKGLPYLLQAFKGVLDQQQKFKLSIVGDGPERRALERFCMEKGLANRVQFSGAIPRERMPRIYQKADLFVSPSVQEGLANVCLEAMASGLPVITTRTGVAELLNGNGFVVERRSCREMESAILQYVFNPDLLERHGEKSRKIAETFGWENTARKYLRIYQTIQ